MCHLQNERDRRDSERDQRDSERDAIMRSQGILAKTQGELIQELMEGSSSQLKVNERDAEDYQR